jgi:hypothetical protein
MSGREGTVYLISPLRRWITPVVVLLAGIPIIVAGWTSGLTWGVVLTVFVAVLFYGAYYASNRTQLITSAAGVRLHHVGFMLESPWNNVATLQESPPGFVLHQPMSSKGAEMLKTFRNAGRGSMYTPEEQALILEQR